MPYQAVLVQPQPPPLTAPMSESLLKVVLFNEIEVNPSDVKHVTKLVGYSTNVGNGLGVVITARTHRLDVV